VGARRIKQMLRRRSKRPRRAVVWRTAMPQNEVVSTDPIELARRIVAKEYAQFCVARGMRAGQAAAEAFALEVTESGAKPYHGMASEELVAMLCEKVRG